MMVTLHISRFDLVFLKYFCFICHLLSFFLFKTSCKIFGFMIDIKEIKNEINKIVCQKGFSSFTVCTTNHYITALHLKLYIS